MNALAASSALPAGTIGSAVVGGVVVAVVAVVAGALEDDPLLFAVGLSVVHASSNIDPSASATIGTTRLRMIPT
jgi:hypothetical protein